MNKKLFGTLIVAMLIVAMVPVVALPAAVSGGLNVNIGVTTDPPKVYLDPNARLLMSEVEDGGRVQLVDRQGNYAFTGEQLIWDVLVYDRNGVEDINDVIVILTPDDEPVQCDLDCIEEGCEIYSCAGEDCMCAADAMDLCGFDPADSVEVECVMSTRTGEDPIAPRDNEGNPIVWDETTMQWYTCTFTVEPGMDGEYWVVAAAHDSTCLWNVFDESEYWYFNPDLSLEIIPGEINFNNVIPGTRAYSNTIRVKNAAEDGSGVIFRLGISGTDLYDASNSYARCGTSNLLELTNFGYFATMGSFSTYNNIGVTDLEGYDNINYENEDFSAMITGPDGDIYGREWVIDANGGLVQEGADVAITFRLDLPKPCVGNWDTGSGPEGSFIMFWAEPY